METRGTRDVRKPMDQRITTKRVHALFRSSRAPRDQLETKLFGVFVLCIFLSVIFVRLVAAFSNFRTASYFYNLRSYDCFTTRRIRFYSCTFCELIVDRGWLSG